MKSPKNKNWFTNVCVCERERERERETLVTKVICNIFMNYDI